MTSSESSIERVLAFERCLLAGADPTLQASLGAHVGSLFVSSRGEASTPPRAVDDESAGGAIGWDLVVLHLTSELVGSLGEGPTRSELLEAVLPAGVELAEQNTNALWVVLDDDVADVRSLQGALCALRPDLVTHAQDAERAIAYLERIARAELRSPAGQPEPGLDASTPGLRASVSGALRSTADVLQLAVGVLELLEYRGALGSGRRASLYAMMLGWELGLRAEALEDVRLGALLHDLGMVAMPDRMVSGDSPATLDEETLVAVHPLFGAQLLDANPELEGVRAIVAQHHERYDGSGAPLGLAGESIELGARIFELAGTLEARARTLESVDAALGAVRAERSRFDPQVYAAFEAVPAPAWTLAHSMLRARELAHTAHPAMLAAWRETPFVQKLGAGDPDRLWAWLECDERTRALPRDAGSGDRG